MIYAMSFSIGIVLILGFLLARETINKKSNKNIVCVGEILDKYFTTDSLELELSYPVWEICNSIRNTPLNWKVNDSRAFNNKESYDIWHYGKNNNFMGKCHSIEFNNTKKEGHELSKIENKFILAQIKALTEFYENIDDLINNQEELELKEPYLTFNKILLELE